MIVINLSSCCRVALRFPTNPPILSYPANTNTKHMSKTVRVSTIACFSAECLGNYTPEVMCDYMRMCAHPHLRSLSCIASHF